MKTAFLVIFVVLSLLVGAAGGLLGGWIVGGAVVLASLLLAVVFEYRIGVMMMFFIMPFMHVHPQLFNFFIALLTMTIASSFISRAFSGAWERMVVPPRFVALGLLLPFIFGFVISWPNLEVARDALAHLELDQNYSVKGYVRMQLLGPFATLGFAWVLASAVRDSARPQRFIVPIAAVGIMITLAIVGMVIYTGISLDELKNRREFLNDLGGHANEWGPMLAVAAAPFLYLVAGSKGLRRLAYLAVLVTLLSGMALTFSRGGYLAFTVIFVVFLATRVRIATAIGLIALIVALGALAPTAVVERAFTGVDKQSVSMMAQGSDHDQLSAGRFALYEMFAPEVLKSPLWGQGIGSAGWSTAVRSGLTPMLHPHNLYLRILMDIGILGLCLLAWFYWRFARGMISLSKSGTVPSDLSAYLRGASVGILGMMAAGLSGGNWVPQSAQMFIWVALGLTLGLWHHLPKVDEKVRRRSFGIKPMPAPKPMRPAPHAVSTALTTRPGHSTSPIR